MDYEEQTKMDVALIVIIIICIFVLPTIFFAACRIHMMLKKGANKRASRVSVVSIAPATRSQKSAIVLPPIRHVPQKRSSNELSTVEAPDPDATGLAAIPMERRISSCYMTELKLMDIGPLPHDQAAVDAQRERENDKRASLAV